MEKDIEQLRKRLITVKIFAWIMLGLIAIIVSFVIIRASHADVNSDAQAAANPYGSYGNLNGLMSYGQQNITASCNQVPDFIDTSYTVGSSGDINAEIQMNTDKGSSYNYSYAIPARISGICSNGFISCPAGEWYGGGVTCNNYSLSYSPSTGFTLNSLGSNIIGVPQTTTKTVALNGTTAQASTVTSTRTTGGLADCFCLNDSCEQGGTPISEIRVNQILTDLGGQAVSSVEQGSPDTIGASTVNIASSPYSIIYSGGASCNSNPGYTTPNNLEGLYNEGGSSLNSEVSSSQVATANSNTESALGLTSTPTSSLTTIQNNSFGGMSGGACQIENMVNFDSTTSLNGVPFAPLSAQSWSGGGSHTGGSYTIYSNGQVIINQSESISYAGGPDCGPSGSITLSLGSSGVNASTSGGLFSCSGSIAISDNKLSPGTITCPDSGSCSSRFGWYFQPYGPSSIIAYTYGTGAGWAPSNSYVLNINDNQYYPVYSQPVNNCSTYQNKSNCTLTGEQVCNQNDSNCVTTLSNSNPVGTPPDFTWTYGQTDDNQPVSAITWTINMNGTTTTVTPSETVDTINYGTLATSSSSAGGGNMFPNINETWECTGNPPYNFNTMNKQETAVTASASMNSTNTAFSYTGVNGNQHNNIAIDNPTNYNSQQYECVVGITSVNSKISTSEQATTALQTTPSIAQDTNTKTLNCTNSGTVNTPVWNCPVPTGYTIQTNCTDAGSINNNNFAPAMVELTVLDKAGSSLICSAN